MTYPRLTLSTFVFDNADVAAAPDTSVSVSARGHGSYKLSTRDSHAAHAVDLRARRASLRVLRTLTDDGVHVVTVRGFGAPHAA